MLRVGSAAPGGAHPCITNILMRDFDNEVGAWCRERQITYTRYCDDMTFSGDFARDEVLRCVEPRLRALGFYLNPGKTKWLPADRRQLVTGIVVNKKCNVPSEERRALRQELHFCQKFGISGHMARAGIDGPEDRYLAQLLGRVNYQLQITPGRRELQEARDWLIKAQPQYGGGRETSPAEKQIL